VRDTEDVEVDYNIVDAAAAAVAVAAGDAVAAVDKGVQEQIVVPGRSTRHQVHYNHSCDSKRYLTTVPSFLQGTRSD